MNAPTQQIEPTAKVNKPKGNQLIVMPMWVTHRVSPVKTKTENLENSRITINGHIEFNVVDKR